MNLRNLLVKPLHERLEEVGSLLNQPKGDVFVALGKGDGTFNTFTDVPVQGLPTNLAADIAELVSRYGRVKLERFEDKLRLVCADLPLLEELARQPKVRDYLGDGSFGGLYERSDAEMDSIWAVAVEETRALIAEW